MAKAKEEAPLLDHWDSLDPGRAMRSIQAWYESSEGTPPPAGQVAPATLRQIMTFTYDQLTQMHSAPQEVIAAPGVGKAINVQSLFSSSNNVTQNFGGVDETIDGLYYFEDAVIWDGVRRVLPIVIGSPGGERVAMSKPAGVYDRIRVDNQPVLFLTAQDWTGGNPEATLRLVVYYTVEDLV